MALGIVARAAAMSCSLFEVFVVALGIVARAAAMSCSLFEVPIVSPDA